MGSQNPPPPDPPDTPAERVGASTGPLLAVDQAELASALAYGLRFNERGKPRRGAAWEMATSLLAEQLVAQLERANFVVLKRPPHPPHSTWSQAGGCRETDHDHADAGGIVTLLSTGRNDLVRPSWADVDRAHHLPRLPLPGRGHPPCDLALL